MKQQGLLYFTDTHLTLIGLFLFLVVFIGAIIWVYRKGSLENYKVQERLVFWDGEANERK